MIVKPETLSEFQLPTKRYLPIGSVAAQRGLCPAAKGELLIEIKVPVLVSRLKADTSFEVQLMTYTYSGRAMNAADTSRFAVMGNVDGFVDPVRPLLQEENM